MEDLPVYIRLNIQEFPGTHVFPILVYIMQRKKPLQKQVFFIKGFRLVRRKCLPTKKRHLRTFCFWKVMFRSFSQPDINAKAAQKKSRTQPYIPGGARFQPSTVAPGIYVSRPSCLLDNHHNHQDLFVDDVPLSPTTDEYWEGGQHNA